MQVHQSDRFAENKENDSMGDLFLPQQKENPQIKGMVAPAEVCFVSNHHVHQPEERTMIRYDHSACIIKRDLPGKSLGSNNSTDTSGPEHGAGHGH